MAKRVVFVVIGLSLLGLLGSWVMRDQIAWSVFKKTIDRQMSFDARDTLSDGLHAAFCGTGTPLPDRTRGGGCLAVVAGDRIFLFDAGEGSAETLALMGLLPSDVEAVFLTHFHSDHINGLGGLALQHVFRGGVAEPLLIYGGPGVERVTNGFNEAYALDHQYRTEHHGADIAPPTGFELEPRPIDIDPLTREAVVLDSDGIRITAFALPHGPVRPALGYRIDYADRSIVVSGDTVYSPKLVEMSKGVDLLVHEALAPKLVKYMETSARANGRDGLATIMKDIPSYHASPADAARAAQEAGVGTLALTHLIPPVPARLLERPFLDGAGKLYDGPLWMMQDGDVISLPRTGGQTRLDLLK